MLLVRATNSKGYRTHLIAAIAMTLSVLEGHFPIASLFRCDFFYLWHVTRFFCISRASCLMWHIYCGH